MEGYYITLRIPGKNTGKKETIKSLLMSQKHPSVHTDLFFVFCVDDLKEIVQKNICCCSILS